MKNPILIVLSLMATPVVLSLFGGVLAWLFSCTGTDYISKCSVPAVTGLVSGLISMAWLFVIAVPLGAISIAVIVVVSLVRGASKKTDGDS